MGLFSNSSNTCISPRAGVNVCVVVRVGGLVGNACTQQLHVVINEKMDEKEEEMEQREKEWICKTMLGLA